MIKRITLLILIVAIKSACLSQAVQIIKGTIVDKDSEIPLPGVNIIIEGTSPLIGTITNEMGIIL